jgi:hypothetical protein
MFEALVDSTTLQGEVSLSAQWAPFNPAYQVGLRFELADVVSQYHL